MVDKWSLLLPGMVLLVLVAFFLIAKMYRNRHRIGRHALWALLGATFFLAIWVSVILQHPMHLWQRIIAAICGQYSNFLSYHAVKHMFTHKQLSLRKSRVFWLTTGVIATLIVLDICLGEEQEIFDSTSAYTATWLSSCEAILGYSSLFFLNGLIALIYSRSFKQQRDPVVRGRLAISLLGAGIFLAGLLLINIAILTALGGHQEYRLPANVFYHFSIVLMVMLIFIALALPEAAFTILFYPVVKYHKACAKKQEQLLVFLHEKMIQIVPSIHLPHPLVRDVRVLIEISDARHVIWSHQPSGKPITPGQEARHLHQLLQTGTIYTTTGEHTPPLPSLRNTLHFNRIVAAILQRCTRAGHAGSQRVGKQRFLSRKGIVRSLTIFLLCLFFCNALFTWYLSDRLMYPQRSGITHVPSVLYEDVQFQTADGILIRGWFVPAPQTTRAPTLLLLHGLADNRTVFLRNCTTDYEKARCPSQPPPYPGGPHPSLLDALHDHGYAILAIDQRAAGESGGDVCTYGLHETRDVAAALAYLLGRPDVDETRLGIYGTSMGSMTAIHAAAQMPQFRAVAVESPFADLLTTLRTVTLPANHIPAWFGDLALSLYRVRTDVDLSQMSNIADMEKLGNRPFYAIGDMQDTVALPRDARVLYNASHSSLRRLWEVPDAGHTASRFLHPDEFYQRLFDFFDQALGRHELVNAL